MDVLKEAAVWLKKRIGMPLTAVLYLLFFSAYTSPLFPKYMNQDSAIFMMVGKGMNQGKQLYLDVFDHKGPILFWIEALGMRFGRNGIFLIQCIFLTVDIWFMLKIAGYFCCGRKVYLAVAAGLIWLAYPLANGNLSEEYSLPFILGIFYFFLKDWMDARNPKMRHSYLYGICFGVLFFIRANNAVTICALILGWMYILIKRRQIGALFQHLLAGAAGIATIALPVCIYFWTQGSLREMFYATFLFNLQYSGRAGLIAGFTNPVTLFRMGILFLPILTAAIVFFNEMEDQELKVIMGLVVGLNFCSLFLGHGYNHYFTIILPIVVLLFSLMPLEKGGEKKKGKWRRDLEKGLAGVVFAGYCVLALRIIGSNFYDYYIDKAVLNEYDAVHEKFSQIPVDERDRVLGYEIPAKYYLMGDVLPCYKYGILQYHWEQSNKQIMIDFLAYVREESPLWLVSEKDTNNMELKTILLESYQLIWEDDYAEYYHLTDQ
ncbi:MAG: hypothetical protein HDQ98_04770 [Lachnospiraceae bacterium]|nr:hypothetical protein [Lachnospiraceae bacterium]